SHRLAYLEAGPDHARPVRVPRELERLHVAADRACRSASLHTAGCAGSALARIRPGRRTDDGRVGRDHLARPDPVPGASAALSGRPARWKRERVRRAVIFPTLLLLGAAGPITGDLVAGPNSWAAGASDDVAAASRSDGNAIELSYDFDGVNGYAFIRRKADMTLARNFEIRFQMRGHGGRNDLQLKLTHDDNVWWK